MAEGPGSARQPARRVEERRPTDRPSVALFAPAFVFVMTNLSLKLQKPVGEAGCQANLASLKLIIARRRSAPPSPKRRRTSRGHYSILARAALFYALIRSVFLAITRARGTLDANGSSKNLRAWFYKSRGIIALAASRRYP